ncbi:hypothetical protein [Acuticoccus sp. I52.16.1]|uniref:hypothetical protein n=1 Tax=Acuticoccus sp. I52.16.1 TaxID=2928472 RepID=UPI001FD51B8F|nr:hypothetical protein [Acuticoccus sp. I52.16.1]UOM33366.1 hypothetical protein MRB58_16075 [Acuticoccus sp. I52.16.1]
MVRTALIAAALAVGLSGCNTAYNYFEEEPEQKGQVQNSTAFGALLTMGGITQQTASGRDYTPRAPLAMPGTSDLPAPTKGSAAEDAVNFPEDHDVRKYREEQELYARGAALDAAAEQRGGRFLPGEITDGPQAKRASGTDGLSLEREAGNRLSREELKNSHKGRSKPRGMLTEDGAAAPRMSLVHPPSDYRTPAETAALPDKKEIENSEWLTEQLYKTHAKGQPSDRIAPQ